MKRPFLVLAGIDRRFRLLYVGARSDPPSPPEGSHRHRTRDHRSMASSDDLRYVGCSSASRSAPSLGLQRLASDAGPLRPHPWTFELGALPLPISCKTGPPPSTLFARRAPRLCRLAHAASRPSGTSRNHGPRVPSFSCAPSFMSASERFRHGPLPTRLMVGAPIAEGGLACIIEHDRLAGFLRTRGSPPQSRHCPGRRATRPPDALGLEALHLSTESREGRYGPCRWKCPFSGHTDDQRWYELPTCPERRSLPLRHALHIQVAIGAQQHSCGWLLFFLPNWRRDIFFRHR